MHRTAFVSGAGSGPRASRLPKCCLGRACRSGEPPATRPGSTAFGRFRLYGGRPRSGRALLRFGGLWRAGGRAGGAFDLVVNNAGYGVFGEFAESTPRPGGPGRRDALHHARLAHAAYRAMRARDRGCLVNVSSLAAEFPLPFMSGYNVAKAGLSALSESLLFETRGSAVNVIDFRPGDYRTAFNQAMHRPIRAPEAPRGLAGSGGELPAAPPPARAAADLRRALLRHRAGIVRSGLSSRPGWRRSWRALVPARRLARPARPAISAAAENPLASQCRRSAYWYSPPAPAAVTMRGRRPSRNGAFSSTATTSTCGSSRCSRSPPSSTARGSTFTTGSSAARPGCTRCSTRSSRC